jgi:hypothetical protein
MINNKIYFLENAAMIQNNLYHHFPKCFPNSFPTGTSCNTMRDPSWNEEIGPIPQNPHGTADIILVIQTNMKNIFFISNEKMSVLPCEFLPLNECIIVKLI